MIKKKKPKLILKRNKSEYDDKTEEPAVMNNQSIPEKEKPQEELQQTNDEDGKEIVREIEENQQEEICEEERENKKLKTTPTHEDENKSPKKITTKKKSQPIKLIRNSFSSEETTPETYQEPTNIKLKWSKGCINFDKVMPHLIQINYNVVKSICPDLELLDEKDVKLELTEIRDRRMSIDRKSERKSESDHINYDRQLSYTSSKGDSESEDTTTNIIAMNRKISIVDDSASKLRPPPSPAKHAASSILYITNLVRPFTLKQLRELLERTGKIIEDGFWTDRIKSKCYVQYETQE